MSPTPTNLDHITVMSPFLNFFSNFPTRVCHLFAIGTLADIVITTIGDARRKTPKIRFCGKQDPIFSNSQIDFSQWGNGIGGVCVLQRHCDYKIITRKIWSEVQVWNKVWTEPRKLEPQTRGSVTLPSLPWMHFLLDFSLK